NRGVIAEGVARLEHWLRAQGRAIGGRAGLRGEDEPIGGGGANGDGAGGGGGYSRSAENQGDVGGGIVREIGEGDQARDDGPVGRALESAAAGAARGADHGAAVIGAEVAELVLQANDRLLGESHACHRSSRWLGLNGQIVGGTRNLAQ